MGQENTMPAFIRCVEAYVSIGEICDALREVYGVQREFLIF
jgi:methylmalonyl-CoA mutase N-terminal domain/subunit